ncbi:MAG: zinc metalloprotease [Saprospirales bacterium]|nr:zinc metalloprotease [Saprospirales bacterium]
MHSIVFPRKLRLLYFLFLCVPLFFACEPQQPTAKVERCGSAEYFQYMMDTDPGFSTRNGQVENLINDYYNTLGKGEEALRGGRALIPVVVHILHNGETDPTNVSDAQIQGQIDVMNEDFRRLNADFSSVPADFSAIAGDSRIEFQLARRDPNCQATNGITRQLAGKTFYTSTLNDAKSTAAGGVDPWDTDKYLNIWVVPDLRKGNGSGILGYSSFPADAANVQGFVVEFNFFGDSGTGTSDPSFDRGRTAVHEFGHFFNLKHIWGDDQNNNTTCESASECGGTDFVDDTPNQGIPTFGTPGFPMTDCCTGTSPGIMFMSFMDYVDDSAMLMFSQGQADRMIASLYTTKASLIGSDGLLPPPETAIADLYMQDTPEDIGNEPNNESDRFYISEDIWIRNDHLGVTNQEHQNPTYTAGTPLYVYVRVRNRGCASAATENVRLYWAKASTGLSWPSPWDGSASVGGAVMGGSIGMQPTGAVAGGEYTVLEYTWNSVPNPADYASFGADQTHFCLLARIGDAGDMTTPETSNLGQNVKNNNNIAWKNVNIATSTGGGREASTTVANYSKAEMVVTLRFEDVLKEHSAFEYGNVYVKLDRRLLKQWQASGGKGTDISVEGDLVVVRKAGATMSGIMLKPGEVFAATLIFKEGQKRLGPFVYFLDLVQYNGSPAPANEVGGQRFWVKVWNR